MTGEPVEPGFRAFVARVFGDEGRAWIATLPDVHALLASRWQLELGPEMPGGLLSCVRAARLADGSAAILKVCPPWLGTRHEIAVLGAWDGKGAPALLTADEELGAMLLERIEPGTHPAAATADQIANLLPLLHVDPPAELPHLAAVVRQRIDNALREGRATKAKAAWALAKVDTLETDPPPRALLHGDFDERNLLVCARRGLCAIDPLPCVGDASYDAGYWVHGNRRPGRRARLQAIVAATDLSGERVRDWAAVVGVHG